MDDMQTFTEESLRRLSYVDLQRCAKKYGIKANAKADKLIIALVSENTPNPVNSVLLKEEDAVVKSNLVSDEHESDNSSVRPRRRRTRTFSIEKPFSVETPDVSGITTPLKITNSECNTPIKSGVKSILSSRKVVKSNKVRSGNCYRVSFITPDKKYLKTGCNTPASSPSSIKCRPQTPAAMRCSSTAKRRNSFIFSPISETPNKIKKWASENESLFKNSKDGKANVVFGIEEKKSVKTPLPSAKSAKKPELIRSRTPNFKKIHEKVFDKMESLDEYQQRRQIRTCKLGKNGSITKKKPIKNCEAKISTKIPRRDNPKKNSMTLRSGKINSKIPIPYQGIKFIPSVTSIKKIKTDFANLAETPKIQKSTIASKKTCLKEKSEENKKTGNEKVFRFGIGTAHKIPLSNVLNTPQNDKSLVRKRTFDLKASLARKLPYKPYKGSLKPLCDTKVNDGAVASGVAHQPLPNKIVAKKREGTRNVLKGVRKNRRFELQMSHRGLAI